MAKFPKRSPDERAQRSSRSSRDPQPSASGTAWEAQAGWYDKRQGKEGDDFHRNLVLPAVLRQLRAQEGQTVLDCCCGNGVLGRHLATTGVKSIGVDASPSLLEAACNRASNREQYILGDAHKLQTDSLVDEAACDHAAMVLAVQDLDPLDTVFKGCAHAVKAGGRLVLVLTHPCFRQPKNHQWGWDEEQMIMYRRLDGYALPRRLPIKTHPGQEASTASTYSYHRPLALYVNALGAAGWAVIASEELCSHRRGSQGRRSMAEDTAHREFPVFLVLTAVRLPEVD